MTAARSIWKVAFLVCCAGVSFGYGIASIAGVLQTLETLFALDLRAEQGLVFVLVIACFAGAVGAGSLSARFGRRPVMGFASVLAAVAYLVIIFEPAYAGLVAARALAGVSIGLLSTVAPMYAAEISSAQQRGAIVGLFQLAVTGGILMAYGASLIWHEPTQWNIVLGGAIAPAVLLMAALASLPESPRWLVGQGRMRQANAAAVRLGLMSQWADIIAASSSRAGMAQPYGKLLRQGRVIGVLALCSTLFILQNLSGIDGILYYAPRIFHGLGFSEGTAALVATFGLGLANFLATLVGVMAIDRLGRRPLLIGGSLIMTIGLVSVVVAALYEWPWLGLSGLCLYIVAFAVSLGPLPYVLMSELFPLAIREQGMALASAVCWLFNALIAWTFLSLVAWLGLAATISMFAFVCLVSLLVSVFYVPETRRISLEKIEANVLAGKPLRWVGRGPGIE